MSIANKLQTVANNLSIENEKIAEQASLLAQINEALDGKTGTMGGGDYSDGYADGYEVGYDDGYDEGYEDGTAEGGGDNYYDAFWDAYQENGNRSNYAEAFRTGWTEATFKPKHDIILGSGETSKNMFNGSSINADLVAICEEQGITMDFSNATRFENTFYGTKFTRIGVVGATNATVTSSMFAYSSVLKTIDKIIMAEVTVLANNAFSGCTALENITFDGVINTNVRLANSSKLSNASIQSIIDHLKDLTGATAKTITLHNDVGAKLTDAQKASASAKNWTLAY